MPARRFPGVPAASHGRPSGVSNGVRRTSRNTRETLRRLGFKPATRRSDALEESAGEMFELPGDNAWLHFMQDDLPRLRQQGWFIDIRADFAYDLTPIDARYAEVEEADDRQWFELELGIEVAGQRVSLLPALTN